MLSQHFINMNMGNSLEIVSQVNVLPSKQFDIIVSTGSVRGLESLEKPWIWLDQFQGLEILEFYKVVLKSLEFNCGQ